MIETTNSNTALSNSAVTQSPLTGIRVNQQFNTRLDLLQPMRRWLDNIEIDNPELARFLSKTIPSQCPFERDIKLFGYRVGHIPPLCKLNPLYDQLIGLRFRALCYLVDYCGEDIQSYV